MIYAQSKFDNYSQPDVSNRLAHDIHKRSDFPSSSHLAARAESQLF